MSHYSGSVDRDVWFAAHFEIAVEQICEFFAGDGISLQGKRVADVGCGDGIIDLGLTLRAQPASLVGLDISPTDVDHLRSKALEHAGVTELPPELSFVHCSETGFPIEDGSFDYVVSWSAFEHIGDPVSVLREIRRVLTADGVLFIQLWPFFDSEHGTHLVEWFPEGFAQHRYSQEQILLRMTEETFSDRAEVMYREYRTLNQITADGLHLALRQAGFVIAKLHLQADAVHVPVEMADMPPSRMGISGVKLLAVPSF
ncbi:class I SAM-dependent methyltransferase [Aeromicrobium sp.]|uniref:class I SAM-dependent methyltransferase n=1 Tax=Aeromicrobium sp. TaxID=1871063 RepID=UPI0019934DBB|nr:class I SAM-dependent methyltransferase [Aeromicrobium sp.]MBC7632000.1 class I SAM-dependent methyltransferase [Aeromicrobium sp.]